MRYRRADKEPVGIVEASIPPQNFPRLMVKRGTLEDRYDQLDDHGSVSAVSTLNSDQGIGAHHSDSPTNRQGNESPDDNAEGLALALEEAPVKG